MINVATQIVHWPGKDTAACDDHALKLKSLASFMGFTLPPSTKLFDETQCQNCINEEEKAKK